MGGSRSGSRIVDALDLNQTSNDISIACGLVSRLLLLTSSLGSYSVFLFDN